MLSTNSIAFERSLTTLFFTKIVKLLMDFTKFLEKVQSRFIESIATRALHSSLRLSQFAQRQIHHHTDLRHVPFYRRLLDPLVILLPLCR